jgi:hypothetical protein
MRDITCTELREVASELALGTLPGDERAAALAHLEHCGECQMVVEELSDAADALLLLAPQAEPPAGFARRVAAGWRPQPPRVRQRMAAVAAAVALVLGGGTAVAAGIFHHGSPSPARFALHAPGVRMARFVAARGENVGGQVFSYAGNPSWVFMTVHGRNSSEPYVCELDLTDGTKLNVGSFRLYEGSGSWGREVQVDVSRIRAVHLLKQGGETAASASFV